MNVPPPAPSATQERPQLMPMPSPFDGFVKLFLYVVIWPVVIYAWVFLYYASDGLKHSSRYANRPFSELVDRFLRHWYEPSRFDDPDPVTLAQYERLKDGMSYEDVVKILGPGEEISRTEILGVSVTQYAWRGGPAQSGISATFVGRTLLSRVELGLR